MLFLLPRCRRQLVVCVVTVTVGDRAVAGSHVVFVAHVPSLVVATAGGRVAVFVALVVCVVKATAGGRAVAGSCVAFVALFVSVVMVTAGVTVTVGDCATVFVAHVGLLTWPPQVAAVPFLLSLLFVLSRSPQVAVLPQAAA